MLSSAHHDDPLAACATNDAGAHFRVVFYRTRGAGRMHLDTRAAQVLRLCSARWLSTHPAHLVNRLKSCHRLFPATPECRKCRSNDSMVHRFNVANPARARRQFFRTADRRGAGPSRAAALVHRSSAAATRREHAVQFPVAARPALCRPPTPL